ncbi:DUF2303 family protein [Agrobacterium vitis]|uniref:DUF2303 family protein n=1 Tax=Agrobacterium vitis TaxID=373 RepID=UPI00307F35E3
MDTQTLIQPSKLPDSGDGIDRIAEMAKAANAVTFQVVETAGLGDGLPEKILLAVDTKNGRISDLKSQIEAYRQGPKRRTGEAMVTTLDSFIDLVNRHASENETVVFASTTYPNLKLTAVINYHSVENVPGHSDHRIGYAFPITPEMAAWLAKNNKPFTQGEFAEWLDEHCAELSEADDTEKDLYEGLFKERFADPSRLIELSRDLEISVGGKVKQNIRLASGERSLVFEETHSDSNGQPISIPGLFMLCVPAWVDGDPVRIPARLRYRVKGGEISWMYQLYRPDIALRDQVKKDLEAVASNTALPVFEGKPEVTV